MTRVKVRSGASTERFDVVVIGLGPAGAVTATELAKAGLSVLALERHEFPRYHIGESLTGVAADVIRDLGLEPDMARLDFVDKPGVKVLGREARAEFFVPVLRPTWQVRRDEFDDLLKRRAEAAGVETRYGSVKQVLSRDGRIGGIAYKPLDSRTDVLQRILADVVVDCSGHSCLLSTRGIAGPRRVDAFGRQVAIFSQFAHCGRDPGKLGNATVIFYSEKHHWAWFIPLTGDTVSVGVVLPTTSYKQHGDTPEEVMQWGLEQLNPDLTERMVGAEQVEPVRVIRTYSYRVEPFTGSGWLCVGDSHRFADPIFSFGVSIAMKEGIEAAAAIASALRTGDHEAAFRPFVELADRGHEAVFDFVRYFWRFPAFFSYQLRGPRRQEVIRMFAGDLYGEEFPVLASMRESLASIDDKQFADGTAAEIAREVALRYAEFQGIEAAYVESSSDGVMLSFVVEETAQDLSDVLHDYEESLYARHGRDRLAVVCWSNEHPALVPAFAGSQRIFDRRPS